MDSKALLPLLSSTVTQEASFRSGETPVQMQLPMFPFGNQLQIKVYNINNNFKKSFTVYY